MHPGCALSKIGIIAGPAIIRKSISGGRIFRIISGYYPIFASLQGTDMLHAGMPFS